MGETRDYAEFLWGFTQKATVSISDEEGILG
jgi:hypothetical protein